MKIANRLQSKLSNPVSEAKISERTITIEVQREMWKGYISEVNLIVEVDEQGKAKQLQSEIDFLEKEVIEQAKDDKESSEWIKAETDKRKKDFLKRWEKDINSIVNALKTQHVEIRKDGKLSYDNGSGDRDFSFISCKLMHNGQEISDATEIDSGAWKYDEGEVTINNEIYSVR